MKKQIVLIALIVGVLPWAGLAQNVKALVGGTLIDGYGGAPIQQSVILIEGERIQAVGQVDTLPIPPNAEIISTEGMSVLPGLWEMHAHLMLLGHTDYAHWDSTYTGAVLQEVIMPIAARQLLHAGITSARDLGAPLAESIAVKKAIARGEIPGPTLYVSGPFIQHEPYPGTEAFRWGVQGVADARRKVRQLAEAGVDCIKLIDQDQMTMEEVYAVVEEAHRHGLPVVGHSHRPEEIRRGLLAGVDNFEHTGLATAPEYPPDVIEMLVEATAQRRVFWTPTITPLLLYEHTRDHPERLDDPARQIGLPADLLADIRQSIQHVERLPYYQLMPARRPTLQRKFQQIRDAGVVQLIGTDSGVPLAFHTDVTWRELDYWVNTFGVAPMEALRAATYWPAVMMKAEQDYGTIAEGKYADIIAVRGNVLQHINILQHVDVIIKHGQRIK